MNRYVVDGLLGDALKGKRILFVAANHGVARNAFEMVSERALDIFGTAALKIRRSHGKERIALTSGGSIRFLSYRGNAHRGLSVDIVFLHSGAMTPEEYLPMLPEEVIRA